MLISAIVAVGQGNVIGKDNQIPWYLPADLAYFKRTTIHHPVIMGRKTFESIGRPLPKRSNIVITRDPFFTATGALVAHTLEEALTLAYDEGAAEAFIIGGGQIYRDSAALWDRIYITEVEVAVEGSVFFPDIDPALWREISSESHLADEKNPYNYRFRVLERKIDALSLDQEKPDML